MLFLLEPNTPHGKIFTALNNEFLSFLEKSIEAKEFNEDLFTKDIGAVCWSNPDTKEKFSKLWDELSLQNSVDRQTLYNDIIHSQDVSRYFSDRDLALPLIQSQKLNKKIADLTKHLFLRTKKLVGIRDTCDGETIQQHFEEYRRLNSNLCQFCGTELLAQRRKDVPAEKQWCAAYDHLLCKDKHPIFAVHPANLLPTCTTCNSKAKGVKELLISKSDGSRRLCFYPYTENCEQLIYVGLTDVKQDSIIELIVGWLDTDEDTTEKLNSWNEVYQVISRVEEEQAPFAEWIDTDCRAINFDDFLVQIKRRTVRPINWHTSEWLIWKHKFYEWLDKQEDQIKIAVWEIVQSSRDDQNFEIEFGR